MRVKASDIEKKDQSVNSEHNLLQNNENFNEATNEIVPQDREGKFFIGDGEELMITISYKCNIPLDNGKIIWIVDYDNCKPTAIELTSSFCGATLKLHTAELDMGIVKTYTVVQKSFEIENISDVDTEVLIKLSDNKEIDYELLDEALQEVDDDGECVGLRNLEYLFNHGKVRIFPLRLQLPAKSKKTAIVEFHSETPETFSKCIEIIPKFSELKLINLYCEVQNPHIG